MYSNERKALYESLEHNSKGFKELRTEEHKFLFIMTNENENVMAKLAKFIFNSMQIREKVIKIENVHKCFC